MHLVYNVISIYYLLLEVGTSKRNFRLPSHGGHFHHSDLAMHHDDNHQRCDSSYSSEEVVMRVPRRSKYHRDLEYSDSEYNYKCKCSCTKCKIRKPKPNSCCKEFCMTSCGLQNNILVVPYPVPFMVYNHSGPEQPYAPPGTAYTPQGTNYAPRVTVTTPPPTYSPPPPTYSPTPGTPTTPSTTAQTTPPPRKTLAMTFSTSVYFDKNTFKRFRIINEKNLRRNMGNNGVRSPRFGRLPKYGIVPIPENLALGLMQQLKRDQINGQYRMNRLALDKHHVDYAGLNIM